MTLNGTSKRFRILIVLVVISVVFGLYYAQSLYLNSHRIVCGIGCQVEDSAAYIIYTPNCTIPAFDLYDPLLKKYGRRTTKPTKKQVCSHVRPLMDTSGLKLIYHEDRLRLYTSSKEHTKCFYQGIIRIEQNPKKYDKNCDRKYKLKEEIPIKANETLIEEDGIVVTCKAKRIIYHDAFYFIQPRKVDEKKRKFKEKFGERNKTNGQFSVIIMGIDSVSRVNLARFMPKTLKFLSEDLKAFDFKGFNKVADNTNPNVIAMLTGWSKDDMKKFVSPSTVKKVKTDDYPFIWKNFSNKGYVTVYAEDSSDVGTFTYARTGFVKEPTDYYMRPFFQAAEASAGHSGNGKKSEMKQCIGPRKSIKVLQDLSLDVAETMKDVPYFSLIWSSSLTHNDLDLAALADQPSVDYLKRLKDGGYLEQAILFFISDHGIRFGKLRQTYPGMIEERMPYVMVRVPDWFREEYPQIMKNMKTNTKRLTSTFDIFGTLREILDQSFTDIDKRQEPPIRWGQSLFREVPLGRTCKDAGIPDHYCSCQHTKEADITDVHISHAAETVVLELNHGLGKFENCSQLSLDKVIGGRVGAPRTKPKKSELMSTLYMVTFQTKPGGGVMEASVKFQNKRYELSSDVSRVNMYGNQSHCITDPIYKKYCFCKDLL